MKQRIERLDQSRAGNHLGDDLAPRLARLLSGAEMRSARYTLDQQCFGNDLTTVVAKGSVRPFTKRCA